MDTAGESNNFSSLKSVPTYSRSIHKAVIRLANGVSVGNLPLLAFLPSSEAFGVCILISGLLGEFIVCDY